MSGHGEGGGWAGYRQDGDAGGEPPEAHCVARGRGEQEEVGLRGRGALRGGERVEVAEGLDEETR